MISNWCFNIKKMFYIGGKIVKYCQSWKNTMLNIIVVYWWHQYLLSLEDSNLSFEDINTWYFLKEELFDFLLKTARFVIFWGSNICYLLKTATFVIFSRQQYLLCYPEENNTCYILTLLKFGISCRQQHLQSSEYSNIYYLLKTSTYAIYWRQQNF